MSQLRKVVKAKECEIEVTFKRKADECIPKDASLHIAQNLPIVSEYFHETECNTHNNCDQESHRSEEEYATDFKQS